MHIRLSPQVPLEPTTLALERQGDTLIVNGEPFDFSPLEDGDTLPAEATGCPLFVGDIERVGGELRLTLILPLGANPSEEARYPLDIIDPPDGPIALPAVHVEPEPSAARAEEPTDGD